MKHKAPYKVHLFTELERAWAFYREQSKVTLATLHTEVPGITWSVNVYPVDSPETRAFASEVTY